MYGLAMYTHNQKKKLSLVFISGAVLYVTTFGRRKEEGQEEEGTYFHKVTLFLTTLPIIFVEFLQGF